jgi:hypothetical protein
MNTTIDYFCAQFKFLQTGSDCALTGPCNVNISQVTGIGDNPEEMGPFQKMLFDIVESFAESIKQAINQSKASGVGGQSASVASGATNNIRPFRSAQAEFNVTAALATAGAARG